MEQRPQARLRPHLPAPLGDDGGGEGAARGAAGEGGGGGEAASEPAAVHTRDEQACACERCRIYKCPSPNITGSPRASRAAARGRGRRVSYISRARVPGGRAEKYSYGSRPHETKTRRGV
eukprot:scaffold111515_cov61-Phaeocystis_antarctica.AAC.5